MQISRWTKILAVIAIVTGTSVAQAAPLTFDCDARINASASVKNLAQISPAVSGTITAKQLRRGRATPGVGASITASDGSSVAAFRLTAASADTTEFDIMFSTNVQGTRENFNLGKVATNAPIAFRLFVDQEGQAHLFINNQSWRAAFTALQSGQETAYCSTGQFEISNLRFSD